LNTKYDVEGHSRVVKFQDAKLNYTLIPNNNKNVKKKYVFCSALEQNIIGFFNISGETVKNKSHVTPP
jgi:hypothetical protein